MIALSVSKTYAYKVIKNLKEEQKKEGYYVNPKCQVPIRYFCERMGLDVDEVKTLIA
ncbi:hypothetical protein [uncultured Ruminococcus sp.]|uniref:hypothetical protein n=1 Tax=uncultured Ruminococcus sp. TaxID=165186 RepID=UPI00265D3CAA|nr:hypothetical protein [uncultured Ruminococcus sp.]